MQSSTDRATGSGAPAGVGGHETLLASYGLPAGWGFWVPVFAPVFWLGYVLVSSLVACIPFVGATMRVVVCLLTFGLARDLLVETGLPPLSQVWQRWRRRITAFPASAIMMSLPFQVVLLVGLLATGVAMVPTVFGVLEMFFGEAGVLATWRRLGESHVNRFGRFLGLVLAAAFLRGVYAAVALMVMLV